MRRTLILAALCATLAACSDGGSGDYPYATTGVDPACRYASTPGVTRAFYVAQGDPECGYLCMGVDARVRPLTFCPPAAGRPNAICADDQSNASACGVTCDVCQTGWSCREGRCTPPTQ